VKPYTTKLTKGSFVAEIAQRVPDVKRKDVAKVVDAISELAQACLHKKGVGEITIPGVVKLQRVEKAIPAIKAGTMVRNPFTGQESAHPGRKAGVKVSVKARPVGAVRAAPTA
jgi:nucleoid DNA-binding protein